MKNEKKQRIVIVGAGTMGTHYARNLVTMKDEFNIEEIACVDTDFQQCDKFNKENLGISAQYIGDLPEVLANVVRSQKMNGIIGATQTDSHISVLKEALSVMKDGVPQITRILQEKPFGLFNEGSQTDMFDIVEKIKVHNIRFGMDSILMFSDVYDHFSGLLSDNSDWTHITAFCTYGKNRTKDTRPAHMGVFGTEGTHAIDIARRLGNVYLPLTCKGGNITQGFITERDPDVPYACCADFNTKADGSGVPIHIQMSLAFDKNYREVIHVFENKNGERIEVTLNFDQQGVDKIFAVNVENGQTLINKETPSNVKLKNAIRSAFGDSVKPYGINQTLGLRGIIEDTQDACRVIPGSQGQSPEVYRPKPFQFSR